MDTLFWACLALIAYPYAIYPSLLVVLNRILGRREHRADGCSEPTVTIILPVHNEQAQIGAKVVNLLELDYPSDKLAVVIVGDGCTDETLEIARHVGRGRVETIALPIRAGKAAALNAGLGRATGDVVVFTDAAIMLERGSLRALVSHFLDESIGCVSGEDHIEGGDMEGVYGRLELLLRREEAKLHSIVGASGCFYAQRRELCTGFLPGMAPDFLSVLLTVKAGCRAISEPLAKGTMKAASSQHAEFTRKVRTFQRGITTLFGNARLLDPLAHPAFSFTLWSHKVMRWLAPVPMLGTFVAAWALFDQPFYAVAFVLQAALYAIAVVGLGWPALAARVGVVRISAFFLLVNVAAARAFALWLCGGRVELWEPTRRTK